MASIKLRHRASKKREDGTAPVYLRITENRKSRHISVGVAVEEEYWNPKKEQVRKSHPQHAVFNSELQRWVAEAHKTVYDLRSDKRKSLTAKAVKRELTGEQSSDFFGYAQEYTENLNVKGKYWEWKKVGVLISKLEDFTTGENLYFKEIDHKFVARFERFMREEYGNAINTIAKNLQILQRIMKSAAKEGVISTADDPFLHYQIKMEKTTKQKLSYEKIEALDALDLKEGSLLKLTRDAFLFSFYCAGIRFGDLCQLTWSNIKSQRIEYQMAKTGTHKSLKLVPPAACILDEYRTDESKPGHFIFPLLDDDRDYSDPNFIRKRIGSRNAVVNRNLKKLAEMADIRINLTFHVSRHSFADYARQEGTDLYSISKALGHASLKTTEGYLKGFDNDAVDDAMDGLFG